jgi:hypothetical protein
LEAGEAAEPWIENELESKDQIALADLVLADHHEVVARLNLELREVGKVIDPDFRDTHAAPYLRS